jgi:hypothetical protein
MPFILALAAALSSPSAERVIQVGETFAARINGAPVDLRIDPAGMALPLIDRAAAERAKLGHSLLAISYAVGPQKVTGDTAVATIDLGAGPARRRVGWSERRFAEAAEGTIGPGGLPDAMVRFRLRPESPNERAFTLPMAEQSGVMGGWGGRFALVTIGGRPIRVVLDPYHRRTLATAGAALRIAAAHGGTMKGQAGWEEIAFGVERPVREMELAQPLAIGPFSISSLGVRTGDFGNTAALSRGRADADEVVVTAKARHEARHDRINIGSDLLDRCSSILFDNAHRQITLTCA